MLQILLVQLPVPHINFGHKTGNIPFAASCLAHAAGKLPGISIDIMPQLSASYMGDAALLNNILERRPDIIGFSTYVWNVTRVLYLSEKIKSHYSPVIILGGPEITSDNPLTENNPYIDYFIQGEGEDLFVKIIQQTDLNSEKLSIAGQHEGFRTSPSPYLSVTLEPDIENYMLLETMRGCPYACAYCYYGKSRNRILYKDDRQVIDGLKWALSMGVKEVYFLDPSLEARSDLASLLKQIAAVNREHSLNLISEIRAESVDEKLAGLLADAGFTWFEIGLQSTNPAALAMMKRKFNPQEFASGVNALKQRGINMDIDLIAGLPGDNMAGFMKTVDYVKDLDINNDVQVFSLSVLPGTEFRKNAEKLGLIYNSNPPYNIKGTRGFTEYEIMDSIIYAEKELDIALYPMPELDLSWRNSNRTDMAEEDDVYVTADGYRLVCKVWLDNRRTLSDFMAIALRVTQPYQLLIPPSVKDPDFISGALRIFTEANPNTPLEMIFYDPVNRPSTGRLLEVSGIKRPHYLDGDQRALYYHAGNRAMMFSLVTSQKKEDFFGPMKRHVHWWRQTALPDEDAINRLETGGYDGILIDTVLPDDQIQAWQDTMGDRAGDLMHISFGRIDLNRRWIGKTAGEMYNLKIMP